jgi:DNA-binding transcriptional ArsR family regulator
MAARILDKLRQSPFSIEELAFDLKRKPFEVRLAVNALLREGSIIKLDTDREGGQFYVELSVGWPQLPYRRTESSR